MNRSQVAVATRNRQTLIYRFRHEMACQIAMYLPCKTVSMTGITSFCASVEFHFWQKSISLHHYVLQIRKLLQQFHQRACITITSSRLRELTKTLLHVIPETKTIDVMDPDVVASHVRTNQELSLPQLQHQYMKWKYGGTIGRAKKYLQALESTSTIASEILHKIEKISAFFECTEIDIPSAGLELLEKKIQGQILPLYERLHTVCTC